MSFPVFPICRDATETNIYMRRVQKHEQQYGQRVSLAMSADATCRGLRTATDGPFLVQFHRGLSVGLFAFTET